MSLYGAIEGAGPGKKIVTGTVTPVSAASTIEVGSQLAKVDAVFAGLNGVPTLTHMWTTAGFSGTTLTLLHRKPTAVGDVTPVNATTPWTSVFWVAIGDAPK